MDLNVDTIILTFSETIRNETLDFTLTSFTDSPENQTVTYALTGGSQTYLYEDTRFINVTFNKEDSDAVQFLNDLLTSENNTYIIL